MDIDPTKAREWKAAEEGFIRDWLIQWRLAGVLGGAVVAMWLLPWMSPPAWLFWPAVLWTCIGWPALNWRVDRHATEALLWQVAHVVGRTLAIVAGIFANWLREAAPKRPPAPRAFASAALERKRSAPIHGGKSAAPHNRFATDPDNSGHWGAKSGHVTQQNENVGQRPVQNRFSDARIEKPTPRPFWNRFFSVLCNLPWLLFIWLATIAVVFFWTRNDTEERIEAKYARAQVKAIERGARAQQQLDRVGQLRASDHQVAVEETRVIVRRAREEITHAQNDEAAHAAYLRAYGELRARAEASAAAAVDDLNRSLAD